MRRDGFEATGTGRGAIATFGAAESFDRLSMPSNYYTFNRDEMRKGCKDEKRRKGGSLQQQWPLAPERGHGKRLQYQTSACGQSEAVPAIGAQYRRRFTGML